MTDRFFFGCFLLAFSQLLSAQSYKISGKVTDAASLLPLPGTTCMYDSSFTQTDSTGRFFLESKHPVKQILFGHENYKPTVCRINDDNLRDKLEVSLMPLQDSLMVFNRTPVDSAAYHLVDSINKALNLAHDLQVMEALISGYIHIYFLSVDYRKLINYNNYEGLRLGLGVYTNQFVSSYFSLGGYYSYGIKDKDSKYGYSLQLFPKWQSDNSLKFSYKRDVQEVGAYGFIDENKANQSEFFRNILVNRMYLTKEKEISFSFRPCNILKFNLFFNQAEKEVFNYFYAPMPERADEKGSSFDIAEAGINMKFAYKEELMRTPGGRILSLGTNYPLVWLNFKKGLQILDEDFNYCKYEFKVSQRIKSKEGQTEIVCLGGIVKGNVPICNLYNGHGSYDKFFFDVENSFATMRINEFFSSEFVSLFMRQKIGTIIVDKPFFHPELVLVTNIGYGKLANPSLHLPEMLMDYHKGYFESGILINKIFDQGGLLNYGFGIYYRYGPYGFNRIADNFGYKLTVGFHVRK